MLGMSPYSTWADSMRRVHVCVGICGLLVAMITRASSGETRRLAPSSLAWMARTANWVAMVVERNMALGGGALADVGGQMSSSLGWFGKIGLK
mmetsp:Transcript_17100/g.40064  ORF Transcript_17100/g.40064 Transcript_17100/m.40064 type:complete len:93 (+) Transcript_17100:1419-1697(+)